MIGMNIFSLIIFQFKQNIFACQYTNFVNIIVKVRTSDSDFLSNGRKVRVGKSVYGFLHLRLSPFSTKVHALTLF